MRAEKVIAMVGGVSNGSLRIFFTGPSAGLRCEGDIDATTRPVLIQALAVVSEQTSGDLHADLGDVSFIDVGGLRVLVETGCRLGGERRFIVYALKPHTRRIIICAAGQICSYRCEQHLTWWESGQPFSDVP